MGKVKGSFARDDDRVRNTIAMVNDVKSVLSRRSTTAIVFLSTR